MKRLLITAIFAVLSLSIFAQSGITTFKYEVRAPSIRIGGATNVRLDSIIQSIDTIKFYTGGTELFSKGAGTWTGTGIGLDTTWAKLSLQLDQVTNESKATMFTSPTFTTSMIIPRYLTPSDSALTEIGNVNKPLSSIFLSQSGSIRFGFPGAYLQGSDGDLYTIGNFGITGDLGLTLSRVNKGWFTNLEITNLPTINGSSLSSALSLSGYLLKTDTASMLTNYALISEVGIGDVALSDSTIVFATPTQLSDSITDLTSSAVIGVVASDSNVYAGYTTRTFVESLIGSGGGLSAERLPFIVGVTSGAPSASDSTVIHSAFDGKHIDLYRDGAKQYQQFSATNIYEGFRINNDTITVNPVWQSNEQVLIDIIQPVMWSYLSLEGEESTLLDSLMGYWKLDETSGTIATDATGVQNGTNTAVIGIAGKIGNASHFMDNTDLLSIPYNASQNIDTTFSISMWFYLDSLASAAGSGYLFYSPLSASPWYSHCIYLGSGDDRVRFTSRNDAGTAYGAYSTVLEDSTWYHVVVVNRGHGNTLQVYLNGSDVSYLADTFSGGIYNSTGVLNFGNQYSPAMNSVPNKVDEIAIWNRPLTSGEVTELYNSGNGKTHPFN